MAADRFMRLLLLVVASRLPESSAGSHAQYREEMDVSKSRRTSHGRSRFWLDE